jgi:hypothetical protein
MIKLFLAAFRACKERIPKTPNTEEYNTQITNLIKELSVLPDKDLRELIDPITTTTTTTTTTTQVSTSTTVEAPQVGEPIHQSSQLPG